MDMDIVCGHISYSHSSRYSVRAMGDLTHAGYFRRGRWHDPPYLVVMCLVRPW